MIRYSTPSDLDDIVELRYKMFEEIGTTNKLVGDFKERTKSFYSEQYMNAKCIHVVYEDPSGIVACAGGIIRSDDFLEASFNCPSYGYVMDAYVSPDHRRQGLAKEMLEHLMKWFDRFGVSIVNLDASKLSGNLYSTIGFEVSQQMQIRINTD